MLFKSIFAIAAFAGAASAGVITARQSTTPEAAGAVTCSTDNECTQGRALTLKTSAGQVAGTGKCIRIRKQGYCAYTPGNCNEGFEDGPTFFANANQQGVKYGTCVAVDDGPDIPAPCEDLDFIDLLSCCIEVDYAGPNCASIDRTK